MHQQELSVAKSLRHQTPSNNSLNLYIRNDATLIETEVARICNIVYLHVVYTKNKCRSNIYSIVSTLHGLECPLQYPYGY
jgi:hypothetical protein